MSFDNLFGKDGERRAGRVLRGCGNQPNPRNLRWNAEAIWRTPVAGAAAYVNPQILQAMQAAGKRLEKTYEQVPRPELAAMRMP